MSERSIGFQMRDSMKDRCKDGPLQKHDVFSRTCMIGLS